MSVEGVWKVEILGPYGWEAIGTVFLEKGRYLGASAHHYSIGTYEADDEAFKAKIRVTQHGERRAIFGAKKKQFDMKMNCKMKKSGRISGTAQPADGQDFVMNIRLSPLDKLS